MSKFSTLSVGISGMQAAQTGLYVTGHNMANVDTIGFTRQQALQHDFKSNNISYGALGVNQVGLGTSVSCIRQIRNTFLDISYRAESGKYNFYHVKSTTGREIEAILGELQSQYSTDSVIKDLFNSLQELSFDPSSLSARGNFVSTAITFIDKAANVCNRMIEYQYNLDLQVRDTVQEINRLVNDIEKYNRLIMDAEMAGDRANDYRDSRAVCLDELSHLIKIDYKEDPRNGRVNITTEGQELLSNGVARQIGLRYCGPNNSLVEPVFTTRTDVLAWDEIATSLFDYTRTVSANYKNDIGHLKGLIISRGMYMTTYASEPLPVNPVPRPPLPSPGYTPPSGTPLTPAQQAWNDWYDYQNAIKNNFNLQCMIPKTMQQFDTIVHSVVTMINNAVAPYDPATLQMAADAPYDLNYRNDQGVEIFVRKHVDRYDAAGLYNEEYPPGHPDYSYFRLYTAGNLMINPALLEQGGYNLIALMTAASPIDAVEGLSDNTLVLNNLLQNWKAQIIDLGDGQLLSVDDAYRRFVSNLGIETSEAINFVNEQGNLLVLLDNKRQAISAVSLDEEMRNMMMYQHAYNAAVRVINTVDSMIDKIINGTGRAGR